MPMENMFYTGEWMEKKQEIKMTKEEEEFEGSSTISLFLNDICPLSNWMRYFNESWQIIYKILTSLVAEKYQSTSVFYLNLKNTKEEIEYEE